MRALLGVAIALVFVSPAAAQTPQPEFMLRGFADFGATIFAAQQSFDAILGSSTGMQIGGGVEVGLPRRLFVNLRASRFREQGSRVFLFEGRDFDLGIPTTVTVTPVQLTGGYRLPVWNRLVPYGGGGIGWYGFNETSEFASGDEDVDDWFTGFHLVGGAEVGLLRWLALGGELEWSSVPDAIGDDRNSVSHEFNESNLGGTTFRVKVIVGR